MSQNKKNFKDSKDTQNFKKGKKRSGRKDWNAKSYDNTRNSDSYNDKRDRKTRNYDESDRKAPFFAEPHNDASPRNDISWWNKNSGTFDNAVKIPFNRITGDTVQMTPKSQVMSVGKVWHDPGTLGFPGFMTIEYIPTIGTAIGPTDAVNQAMDALYAKIYREYTGAANFTKSELAFHILHAEGIACMVAEVKRILRTVSSYAQQNHNFPRGLYQALTGETNDQMNQVVNKLPSLRARLNRLIYNFNSLYIPKFTDVFDRWYSLSSNVWMDEDLISASGFVFTMSGYYKYIEAHEDPETGTTVPPVLQYNRFYAQDFELKVDAFLRIAEGLMAEIRNSANFGIVNAAIAKATIPGDLQQIELFAEGELLKPEFSKEMLYQINNMFIIGQYLDENSLNVTEDVELNTLKFMPQAKVGANGTIDPVMNFFLYYPLNSYDSDISPEFIMEATRLMPHRYYGSFRTQQDRLLDVATEIPFRMWFTYPAFDCDDNGNILSTTFKRSATFYSNSIIGGLIDNDTYPTPGGGNVAVMFTEDWNIGAQMDEVSNMFQLFGLLSRFRCHPYIHVWLYGYNPNDVDKTSAISAAHYVSTIGDMTTYTTITDSGLRGLNETALLSVYHVF